MPLDIEIHTTLDLSSPGFSVDLTALGPSTPFELDDVGGGRYTGQAQVTPLPRSSLVLLPVERTVGNAVPEILFNIELEVFPAEERVLYADAVALGWEKTRSVSLDPKATDQVFEGETSLGVEVDVVSSFGWVPIEPVETRGYLLRFAFHPGDVQSGTQFSLIFETTYGTIHIVELIADNQDHTRVDLERQGWQVIEIPLHLHEPIQRIEFRQVGMTGTFYLDDIRLIPRPLPDGPIVEEFPRQIRFVRGTEELIGVAGLLPLSFDIEVFLDLSEVAPSLTVDG